MRAGQILFWPDHEFDDGGTSDKLLVVLNEQRDGIHLAAYTTSQWRVHLSRTQGCHVGDGVFFIPKKVWGFSKDTWIQLYRVQEYRVEVLEEHHANKRIRELRCLDAAATAGLINCYMKCPDVTDQHEWLLGKRRDRPG